MPLHDAYARRTPYELAFPSLEFAEERFGRLEDEIREHGFTENLDSPERFLLVGEVGRLLRDLRSEDDPPELIDQYGLLLYHAYRFRSAGHPLYLADEAAARALTAWVPERAVTLDRASHAFYLQLPQHLFWVSDGQAYDSLDGFFVTWTDAERVDVLAVAGVRPDRGGFTVLAAPGLAPSDLDAAFEEPARPDGEDFSTSLPGAELESLLGVESMGELARLAAAALSWPLEADEPERAPEDGRPAGSALDFRRIRGRGTH